MSSTRCISFCANLTNERTSEKEKKAIIKKAKARQTSLQMKGNIKIHIRKKIYGQTLSATNEKSFSSLSQYFFLLFTNAKKPILYRYGTRYSYDAFSVLLDALYRRQLNTKLVFSDITTGTEDILTVNLPSAFFLFFFLY